MAYEDMYQMYGVDPSQYQDFPTPTGPVVPVPEEPAAAPAPATPQMPNYSGPLPEGYSQGEVNEWLSRNPGDEHRVMSALSPKAQPMTAPTSAQMMPQTQASGFQSKLESYLDKVLSSGGMFDSGLVQQRKESAKDQFDMARRGRVSSLKADLASRGLLSLPGAKSGAEVGALSRLDADLGASYGSAIRDIFSNEQENASNRFMSALGLGTQRANANDEIGLGMSRLNLDRDLGFGKLDLDRMLGTGNLALGQSQLLSNDANNRGRLALDTELAKANVTGQQADQIRKLVEDYINANNIGSGGYY
jgi:hypothetical protein